LLAAADVRAQLPVAGLPVPQLASVDSAVQSFMQTNNVSAGTVAVMRNGVVVYHRAFGWQDQQKTVPLAPNTIMRLASVTKPLTAASVRKLIGQGKFTLNSRVFSVDEPGSGLLDHAVFGGTYDARLKNITVNHLLQHTGGWDRDIAGDHTYRERTIASAMGVPSPPGRDLTLNWILGEPLQYDPGTTYAYSNIGYMVLGLIAEKYSGKPQIDFLRQDVLASATFKPEYLVHARTFAADQDPREPYYDSAGSTATNVFWPAESSSLIVPRAYGGFDVEARIGQGGVAASPLGILEYMKRFQIAGSNIGGTRPNPGSWTWSHTGGYAGTSTVATQKGNGIDFVAMFNKANVSIGSTLSTVLGQIVSWPTENIAAIPVSVWGDYDLNGVVEAQDYTVWRQKFGMSVRWGTSADGNGDGLVDARDYIVWRNNLGRTLPAAAATLGPPYPVPEPVGIVSLAVCVSLSVVSKRGRRAALAEAPGRGE
jgi:CubicO group peptidase (beta-lactamase class C family)